MRQTKFTKWPQSSGPERDADPAAVAALSADWVTIWQSELAGLATDREAAEQLGAVLSAWLAATAALRPREPSTGSDAPSRPASVAAAFDAGGALADLQQRMAELERRLDAALAGSGPG